MYAQAYITHTTLTEAVSRSPTVQVRWRQLGKEVVCAVDPDRLFMNKHLHLHTSGGSGLDHRD